MPNPHWLEQYEQSCAEERRQALESLTGVLPQLQALGATSVVVPYNGYGDEGATEPPVAYAGETEIPLPKELAKTITAAAQALLPEGYENNAGAFGELQLDVTERKVVRDHSWRIEEVECDVEEYPL
jgi:hypothetical protein